MSNSEIPSKFNLLEKMIRLQSNFSSLLQDANSYTNRGDLNSAIKAYDKLIATCKELIEIALLHNRQHYEPPIEILSIIRPLINAMFMQADVLQSMGNLKQAEDVRKETLAIPSEYLSSEHLSQSDLADMERSRAESLIIQGRFNEALVAFKTSRELFESDDNKIKSTITTIDMVEIYRWLGDYERALIELKRAEEMSSPLLQDIFTSFDNPVKEVESFAEESSQIPDTEFRSGLKNIENISALREISKRIKFFKGLVNEYLDKIQDAEISFQDLLTEYEKQNIEAQKLGENRLVESNLIAMQGIKSHLATLLIKKGNYQEGLYYAYALESSFKENGILRPKRAVILKTQSDALLKLGKPNEALEKVEAGIKDLERYYDPDLLWKLQWSKGRTLYMMGQKDKALEAYSEAVRIVNNLRKAPLGYRLDSTYMKDKLELFEMAINLACINRSAKQCCEFMELIKSRILTATLSIPRGSQSENTSELERHFDELTLQLNQLEYAGYKEGWSDKLKKNRKSVLDQRADVLERIRISDSRWRTMTEPIPFDLDKVARVLLDRGQAALNLFYQSDKVVVTVLIKDGQSTVAQVTISSDIQSRLENYQRNLQKLNQEVKWYDLSEGLHVHAEHIIPSEILTQALQAKSLIIVPHNMLHLVPWAGLTFNGKRLFEYCPIGILPNLSCIVNLNANFSNRPRVALIGSPDYEAPFVPLVGSEMEAEDIQKMYSDYAALIGKPLIGKEATEENFWKLARFQDAKGGILHVICHGTFDPYEPMNSGLFLTKTNMDAAEIAKVDAAEIARSSIKYDEVILSACSTGTRPIQVQNVKLVADDIIGLPGAFLEAGAKSILVSIPRANDIAAIKFMRLYHMNRLQGKTPLFALQETQKAMLYNSSYPYYYWIGFTVYGCQ